MVSFKARRSEPELVSPARPTPRETNALSDIDDQRPLRYYETVIGFFRSCPGRTDRPGDLIKTIKAALAEALVYYYPVAGRLRETAGGKLVVDCTAEGVVFVEADADVRLEEFGEPLLPPYPCVEELLCDPGDTRAVIGRPLLLMQVTQLKCGGFVAGFHMCHNIADGFGMIQLMITIAELTCGGEVPSILPIWERELLSTAHSPSLITYPNPAYQPLLNGLDFTSDDVMLSTPLDEMVVHYFIFGPREITTLRSQVPGYLADSTTCFELITAVMWRCRTIALGYKSSQRVRLMITMNARGRWNHHTLIPWGYYGNAHVSPIVEVTVDELRRQPLADTVELVRKTKLSVTKECMKSMVDTIAFLREWPSLTMDRRTYDVSDTKWIAAGNGLQLGWAEFVGGGIPVAGDLTSKMGSDHMKCKNEDGEDSTVVSILLPRPAMERFKKEMAVWLNKHDEKNFIIPSSL
ncbi:acyl transferase 1-like [Phragmites australis]|uniref:acyl transferase 1-like n=1 Tax=Phragmites australis TaxID=29695 RepID=UPI002D794AD6|nr:acyl transferase 1-like [Phragmites australis]